MHVDAIYKSFYAGKKNKIGRIGDLSGHDCWRFAVNGIDDKSEVAERDAEGMGRRRADGACEGDAHTPPSVRTWKPIR